MRELRSSTGKFAFVTIAVAMGVGALTGVRSFSHAFGTMLLSQARTLMAGDIQIRSNTQPTTHQKEAIASLGQRGVIFTQVTVMPSMVAAPAGPGARPVDPVLATVKAVDPATYPFYGSVESSPTGVYGPRFDAQSVLASQDLLVRLGLQVDNTITIGGQPFRIVGIDVSEPDRLQDQLGFSVGPRLLMTRAGLDRTGLLQLGSIAQQRFLFRVTGTAVTVSAAEDELQKAFPQSRITDFHSSNPTLQEGLDHSTTFLSLISLMALIIGALGVATAMRSHLQLRMDSIATMKVLGARTGQIIRIYGLQTLLLGLAGGVLGVALSAGVERVFPRLIQHFFPNMPPLGWSWGPAFEGLTVGVLITLLFTLPALLSVRRVSPSLILRRYMPESRPSLQQRAARAREALLTGAVLFGSVALIAVGLIDEGWRDSLRIGVYFLVGIVLSLLVVAGVTWALLRVLKALVSVWNRAGKMPVTLRHGLSNIYRPGSQAQSVLVALGVGVMFTLAVYLLQRSLLDDLARSTPPGVANLFLIDIPPEKIADVENLLQTQASLESPPEIVATVQARISAINGVPAEEIRINRFRNGGAPENTDQGRAGRDGFGRGGRGGRGFLARPQQIAASNAAPGGLDLIAGSWWKSDTHTGVNQTASLAVAEDNASNLGLHLGDQVSWETGERHFDSKVAAIFRPEPHRMAARIAYFVSPGPLDGLPAVANGGVRVKPEQIPEIERQFYARFPTVTVVDINDIIVRVQEVVDQISLVVHFVSFFAVFAGVIILSSSIAGTRFRRIREIAVLKTFGATRTRIAGILSTEFLLLGAVAGAVGSLLAIGFTYFLAHRLIKVDYHVDWPPNLICVAATSLIAALAGWLASVRILGHKPLDVLRGE